MDRAVVVIPAHDEARTTAACLKADRHRRGVCAHAGLDRRRARRVHRRQCAAGRTIRCRRALRRGRRQERRGVAGGWLRLCAERAAASSGPTSHASGTPPPTRTAGSTPTGWSARLDADADMVLGVVRVTNWRHFSAAVGATATWPPTGPRPARRGGGHDHVHGANMGFRADAYWESGGFRRHWPPARTSTWSDGSRRAGHRIHRDADLSVETSARSEGRAPRGFAAYLKSVSRAAVRHDRRAGPALAGRRRTRPSRARFRAARARRWWKLAALTENDVVAGQIGRGAHRCARDPGRTRRPKPEPGQLWGVWAAEAPQAVVTVARRRRRTGRARRHQGVVLGRGNLHARPGHRTVGDDNVRGLYAVDLSQDEVEPLADDWHNVGMHGSRHPVGAVQRRGRRPGRPARRLPDPTRASGTAPSAWRRAGSAAHAVSPRRCTAPSPTSTTGRRRRARPRSPRCGRRRARRRRGDAGRRPPATSTPSRTVTAAELIARRVRAVVERAVDEAIARTGRALGPGPAGPRRAGTPSGSPTSPIYVRQSHAERDLAALGKVAAR